MRVSTWICGGLDAARRRAAIVSHSKAPELHKTATANLHASGSRPSRCHACLTAPFPPPPPAPSPRQPSAMPQHDTPPGPVAPLVSNSTTRSLLLYLHYASPIGARPPLAPVSRFAWGGTASRHAGTPARRHCLLGACVPHRSPCLKGTPPTCLLATIHPPFPPHQSSQYIS